LLLCPKIKASHQTIDFVVDLAKVGVVVETVKKGEITFSAVAECRELQPHFHLTATNRVGDSSPTSHSFVVYVSLSDALVDATN
jgi:hypothetical protein